jgi:hypothetical protein
VLGGKPSPDWKCGEPLGIAPNEDCEHPATNSAATAQFRISGLRSSDVPNSDAKNAAGRSHTLSVRHRGPEKAVRGRQTDIALRRTAQELGDFVLHGFQFVQTQLWIGHDEDISGRALFVN